MKSNSTMSQLILLRCSVSIATACLPAAFACCSNLTCKRGSDDSRPLHMAVRRDSDGLRHVKDSHCGLQDARIQVQGVLCNALPEPCRIWEVLGLKLLIPAVQRMEAILPQLLIPTWYQALSP